MAEVLLGSQRVLPAAAQAAGFEFAYPTLDGALKQLLG
jgi:NAD dependent epimerase/dehydratase family enzyme